MNTPIHNNEINRYILKPRFKVSLKASQEIVIKELGRIFKNTSCKYSSKIVNHHIVVDIPEEDNHFWSPQLHLEIEKETAETVLLRGHFGPKPQVWTFFMFLHFAVALSFFVFFVIAYSNYTLNKDYAFALTMCVVLPIIWIGFYIAGQLGKKKGHTQMQDLHDFLMDSLSRYNPE
ncbi:MAG: GTP-binding protein [Flavobacteriaceae bacterium]|nr:GTP-binding protein [Flavobacteriaceae bacterium]